MLLSSPVGWSSLKPKEAPSFILDFGLCSLPPTCLLDSQSTLAVIDSAELLYWGRRVGTLSPNLLKVTCLVCVSVCVCVKVTCLGVCVCLKVTCLGCVCVCVKVTCLGCVCVCESDMPGVCVCVCVCVCV